MYRRVKENEPTVNYEMNINQLRKSPRVSFIAFFLHSLDIEILCDEKKPFKNKNSIFFSVSHYDLHLEFICISYLLLLNFKISINKWCEQAIRWSKKIRIKNGNLCERRESNEYIKQCRWWWKKLKLFMIGIDFKWTGNHYFHTTPSSMEISF
jgi:hypothetical protein